MILILEVQMVVGFVLRSPLPNISEKKKRTRPPPKENLLGNFSGLKEKLPGRWWIQKRYENQENHTYHRNLASVAPIFFGKEKFCTGAGRCMLSLSQHINFICPRRRNLGLSCTRLRVPPVALHVSRYTCRS